MKAEMMSFLHNQSTINQEERYDEDDESSSI
jgi:hypothetical protein